MNSVSLRHKSYTKHLVATNVISSYLIWGEFSNAVYRVFIYHEEYYSYNLYFYNIYDECLYYKRSENENNETKIDVSELIIVTINENTNTNTSIIFKKNGKNYDKFC